MPKTFSSKRNVLVLSDVHLGHRNTPMPFILKNLKTFFKDFAVKDNFDDLKVIFIAGDLWDEVVHFSNEHLPAFMVFWFQFCSWCLFKGIKVRLLKGTPLHDGNQGKTVTAYTKTAFPALDYAYYDDIAIETITDLELTVLYVPDECRTTAEQAYQDVRTALYDANRTSVDIAIMHGMFTFQLGDIPMSSKVHREKDYLDIVDGFVAIGHIHSASQYERIFAQGSFDRIAHGEEGDKGALYFHEAELDHWEPVFLVNSGAKIYKTITIKPQTKDPLLKVEAFAKTLPDFSFLRIVADEGSDILQSVDVVAKRFPLLSVTRKAIAKKKQHTEKVAEKHYVPLVLNRETLTEAIVSDVSLAASLTVSQSTRLYHLLEALHV